MRKRLVLAFVFLVVAAALADAPAHAEVPSAWSRPVPGRVVRAFQAPRSRFGKGHLGVDLAAAPGTAVRAVGAGVVVFAGTVAAVRHVVIRHPDGRRTSYAFLATIAVRRGQSVGRGAHLGTTGGRGENHDGTVLHLGLRIGDTFVDPMQLFTATDLSLLVHLTPDGIPSSRSAGAPEEPGDDRRALAASVAAPSPPIRLRPRRDPSPLCDHPGSG